MSTQASLHSFGVRTPRVRVAITGAVRGAAFDARVYDAWCEAVRAQLREWNLDPAHVTLVSPALPWGAHVATTLFLSGDFKGLELHTPFRISVHVNRRIPEFTDFGRDGSAVAVERAHRDFSRVRRVESLEELHKACSHHACVCAGYTTDVTATAVIARISQYLIVLDALPAGGAVPMNPTKQGPVWASFGTTRPRVHLYVHAETAGSARAAAEAQGPLSFPAYRPRAVEEDARDK